MASRVHQWFCLLLGIYASCTQAQYTSSYVPYQYQQTTYPNSGSYSWMPTSGYGNNMQGSMESMMQSMQALQQLMQMFGQLGPMMTGQPDGMAELNRRVANLEEVVYAYNGSIGGEAVAFTASLPQRGMHHDKELSFGQVLTNEGQGYNPNNGYFTCSTPGLYYFIVHFVKLRSPHVDLAGCNIMHNDYGVMRVYIDPEDMSDEGSYGFGNSIVIRLNPGDVVKIGGCVGVNPADTLDDQSSFSGFLVHKDIHW